MKYLVLNTSSGLFLINTGTIIRVEASSNYSKIFLSDNRVLITARLLKWFEEQLPSSSFVRLHRSHLINNSFVLPNQPVMKSVRLKNDTIIPVSKRRKRMAIRQLAAACIAVILFCGHCFSQNVGIGTSTPHASAQLEVNSTTKGTLITSMTTTQRISISNPATGLLVFDLNKKTIYMYDGNRWLPLLYSNTDKNPPVMQAPFLMLSDDYFGYKVDIDGDYAIVGAYGRTQLPNPLDAGIAYIYFRNNNVWELQDVLQASDGQTDDFFGKSVSISGDYAVVGAYGDDVGGNSNQGSAYIFVRSGTTWTQQDKVVAPDGLANDFFAYSVSLSGDVLLAGAYGDNVGANLNQGSAYVFTRSGTAWNYQAKLTASDGATDDFFGASVSLSGSYAIVGAYGDDIGGNPDQGSAYSFYELTNPAGWTTGQAYHQKLTAADGDAGDFYGVSVSIYSSTLVIGASGDDVGVNSDQGSAYVYFRNPLAPFTWILPAKITAADGASSDNFGISVARTQGDVLVGAYRRNGVDGTPDQGCAYLFTGSTTPVFVRRIDDDSGQPSGFFGFSVGVSGKEVIIGAYGKNNNAGQVGFLNIQ